MAPGHIGHAVAQSQPARQIVSNTIECGSISDTKRRTGAASRNFLQITLPLIALTFLLWPLLLADAKPPYVINSDVPISGPQNQACKNVQISDAAKALDTAMTPSIEAPICEYFEALNHSDLEAVLKLYTEDPVMLPFLLPTVVGPEAVRHNYENTFGHVRFQMHTTIQEVVQMSPEWAFVRTDSSGLFIPVTTGKGVPSNFHELFLLRKGSDTKWRIARYAFSPTSALPIF